MCELTCRCHLLLLGIMGDYMVSLKDSHSNYFSYLVSACFLIKQNQSARAHCMYYAQQTILKTEAQTSS